MRNMTMRRIDRPSAIRHGANDFPADNPAPTKRLFVPDARVGEFGAQAEEAAVDGGRRCGPHHHRDGIGRMVGGT